MAASGHCPPAGSGARLSLGDGQAVLYPEQVAASPTRLGMWLPLPSRLEWSRENSAGEAGPGCYFYRWRPFSRIWGVVLPARPHMGPLLTPVERLAWKLPSGPSGFCSSPQPG